MTGVMGHWCVLWATGANNSVVGNRDFVAQFWNRSRMTEQDKTMNNLLAASSRMAARAMAALIMLGLATPGAFAAEQHRSSDRAGSAGASGNTSVNRELQRLFNQSGQQMPSMRTADLPYATTPQMYRVRKRAAEPAGPKK